MPDGKSLRDMRKAAGVSQADVAAAVGVTRVYYTQIENGQRIPRPAILKAIGEVFGLSMDELYSVLGGHTQSAPQAGGRLPS